MNSTTHTDKCRTGDTAEFLKGHILAETLRHRSNSVVTNKTGHQFFGDDQQRLAAGCHTSVLGLAERYPSPRPQPPRPAA